MHAFERRAIMWTRRSKAQVALVAAGLLTCASAFAETVAGQPGSGSGPGWQASWLDLKPNQSFKQGETLRVRVEGTAENFLFRLLPATSPPSSSDGIEGPIRKVPKSGSLDIKLERDHPNVKQVSAHAGPEAWGKALGPNNGSISIVSVERLTK
jgi:hypothetical protein